MARVGVIGGHGKVALHLERLLSGRGDEVIVLIPSPSPAADVEAAGAGGCPYVDVNRSGMPLGCGQVGAGIVDMHGIRCDAVGWGRG